MALLTSGEAPATSFSQDGGTRARVLTLWGVPFGKADEETGKLVEALRTGILLNYGHAGPRLIEYVLSHRDCWPTWQEWQRRVRACACYIQKAQGNSVVMRLADALAALTVVGLLAAKALGLKGLSQSPVKALWTTLTSAASEADRTEQALRHVAEWACANQDQFFGRRQDKQGRPASGWAARWDGDHLPSQIGLTRALKDPWEFLGLLPANLRKLLKDAGHEYEPTVQGWKALESFVEYGCWEQPWVEYTLAQLIEDAPGRCWHGYRITGVDDTKVHRTSQRVWGACTLHEYTARCPNRASTVRAHTWVVAGAILANPDQPAWFLPEFGRLYFRQSQLPAGQAFRTKNDLVVELLRRQAHCAPGPQLGVFDGAYAVGNVVRPLVRPPAHEPRIDFLTRLRHDARLHHLPPTERRRGQRGPTPRWGQRLPPPRQGGRWPGSWRTGQAFISGRRRQVRWKEVLCQWHVLGHDESVKAVVAEVEDYDERFYLVSSATRLSGLQLVELFCARFRQEDGFRDLKQRLGGEECRAWTEQPIVRTTQALFVTMSLPRLLQFRLQAAGADDWWLRPPWNRRKDRPSVLDVERLLRAHREEMQAGLAAYLRRAGKTGPP